MESSATRFFVKRYSHHVVITGFDLRGKRLLDEYTMSRLGMFNVFKRWDGTWEKKLAKVYAAARKDRAEYRFHIYSWPSLPEFLMVRGITQDAIIVEDVPLHESVVTTMEIRDGKEMFDYQLPASDYIVAPGKSKLLVVQTGKGKAQPLDSHVKIPGGWKQMGSIKVGDIVTAHDGTPTKVIAIHPQGTERVFRVTFADGRNVECSGEHLWRVYRPNRTWDSKVVDTHEVWRLLNLSNNRLYIDLCESEKVADADLPIDPYLLGLLLGDGSMVKSVSFTTADEELASYIDSVLPEGHTLNKIGRSKYQYQLARRKGKINDITSALKTLGLFGHRSPTKFIPECYLSGSTAQRLALLQGLMDTDGTIGTPNGSPSFTSCSFMLASQVRKLVWSLGGIATIRSRIPTFTHKGEKRKGLVAYTVGIRFKNPNSLFRLTRKKLLAPERNQYSDTLKLSIKSVELIGEKETQCITIDHPDHLYVTNNYIVTHNSRILMHALTRLQKRTVLILKPMYIQRWLDDLMESKKHDSVMKMKPGELMVVRGSADLRRLLELAVKGELTAQLIIISNKTMYNYIETYNTLNTVEGTYPVPPGEFFQTLKAAYRAIDEYHQDFHLNFILDLYTHCEKVISLSATMTSDKPFINKMYNLAMPVGERFTGISYDKYIAAYAMYYRLRDNHPLRWIRRGRTSYSHTAFEESLMKHKPSLKRYLDMIIGVVRSRYCQIAAPGQKMLIFCATVEFCGVLRDALRDATIGYDIRRYTSDDSYDNLIMADIAVSTLQSAGTAVDIPGLRVTLMTVALMSQQANEQALGRLRKLRMWPDVTPEFYYLVCRDIESHMNYDNAKKVIFLDKVLSLKEIELSDNI